MTTVTFKDFYDGTLDVQKLSVISFVEKVQGIRLLENGLATKDTDPHWKLKRDSFVRNTITTTSNGYNYNMIYENFLYCIRVGDYENCVLSFKLLVTVNSAITDTIIQSFKSIVVNEIGISN